MVILLLYIWEELSLLVDEQVDQAMYHGGGVIDARVGGLAEEVGQVVAVPIVSGRGTQLINDPAK
jgi:hypothetical protein